MCSGYCVSTVLCCIIGSALGQTQRLGPEGEKRRLAPHSEEQSISSSHSALPLTVHLHIWPSLCRSAVAHGRFPPLRKRASAYRVRPVPIQSAHSLWAQPVAAGRSQRRLQVRFDQKRSAATHRHGTGTARARHGAECTGRHSRHSPTSPSVRPPCWVLQGRHRQCARIARSAV